MLAVRRRVNTTKAIASAVLTLASLSLFAPAPVHAQFAQPIVPANDISYQLQQQQQQPLPPPPGSGPTPTPVNPGDQGGPQPPPTGQADPTPGTNFPTGLGTTRQPQQGQLQNKNGRGTRQVVTQTAPYPATVSEGNRNKVVADSPAAGYPKEQPLYNFQGPLPTVRTFCRYLVILGAVCGTIFMALAATAVVLGHPYAGGRVIAAASGLILLFMGYTIWKIVQMNTFNANSNNPAQINQAQPQGNVVQPQAPNTPVVPNAPGGVGRSPMPVAPLNGN